MYGQYIKLLIITLCLRVIMRVIMIITKKKTHNLKKLLWFNFMEKRNLRLRLIGTLVVV